MSTSSLGRENGELEVSASEHADDGHHHEVMELVAGGDLRISLA